MFCALSVYSLQERFLLLKVPLDHCIVRYSCVSLLGALVKKTLLLSNAFVCLLEQSVSQLPNGILKLNLKRLKSLVSILIWANVILCILVTFLNLQT